MSWFIDVDKKDIGTIFAVEVYRIGGFHDNLPQYQKVFKTKAEAQNHVNSLSKLRIFESLPNLYGIEKYWEAKDPVRARIVEIHISQSCAELKNCSFDINVSDFSHYSPESKKYHFVRVFKEGKHLEKYDKMVVGAYNDAMVFIQSLRNLLGNSVEMGVLSVNLGGIDNYISYRKDGIFNLLSTHESNNTILETFSNPLGILAIIVLLIFLLLQFNH